MALQVIRGGRKAERASPRRFNWDHYFQAKSGNPKLSPQAEVTVIPILDGWIRLLEKKVMKVTEPLRRCATR